MNNMTQDIMFMYIKLVLYDVRQPKMAVIHSFKFSFTKTSVTFYFHFLSILIGFVADCMIKQWLLFHIVAVQF